MPITNEMVIHSFVKVIFYAKYYQQSSPKIHVFFYQVHHLVAIELAYINTKHPDFTDAAQVSASVNSQQVSVCLFFHDQL